MSDSDILIRRYNGSTWDNIYAQTRWDKILNKPSTFSPSYHTHAFSTITGTLAASQLPASGVTAGTYRSVTVDTYGRVTSGSQADTDTNTDTKVTQTVTASGNTSIRPLLLGYTYSDSTPSFSTVTNTVYASHNAYIKPSNGYLYAPKLFSGGTEVSVSGHTHSQYLTAHQSLSGYATQTWVSSQGYLTSHQSLAGYVPTSRTVNGKALSSNISLTAADVGASATTHTHTKSQITDFPTSMPASDVSSWAKATTKPTYTYSEVGASPLSHGHEFVDIYDEDANTLDDVITSINTAISGKANSTHTHTKSQITDFPTSMPASDVYAWAKASAKPSYNYSEVGAAASSHGHSNASTSAAGFMTAAMVTKLNGISTGANNYSLPTASSSVLGGVKVGSGLSISNGVLSAIGGGVTVTELWSGDTLVLTSGNGYSFNGTHFVGEFDYIILRINNHNFPDFIEIIDVDMLESDNMTYAPVSQIIIEAGTNSHALTMTRVNGENMYITKIQGVSI